MEQQGLNSNQLMIGGVALIIIVAALGYYYWSGSTKTEAPETLDVVEMQTAIEEENQVITDIGASADAATLKDAIPTVTPSTNPINNIYKNPFE